MMTNGLVALAVANICIGIVLFILCIMLLIIQKRIEALYNEVKK